MCHSSLTTAHRTAQHSASPRTNLPGRAVHAAAQPWLRRHRAGSSHGPHPAPGRTHTYHLVIDFVEVDFADFFHHVFVFKSNEAKSCSTEEQKKGGEKEDVSEVEQLSF